MITSSEASRDARVSSLSVGEESMRIMSYLFFNGFIFFLRSNGFILDLLKMDVGRMSKFPSLCIASLKFAFLSIMSCRLLSGFITFKYIPRFGAEKFASTTRTFFPKPEIASPSAIALEVFPTPPFMLSIPMDFPISMII